MHTAAASFRGALKPCQGCTRRYVPFTYRIHPYRKAAIGGELRPSHLPLFPPSFPPFLCSSFQVGCEPHLLWSAGEGILRTEEFSGLAWDTEDAAAPLGDVLKVRGVLHPLMKVSAAIFLSRCKLAVMR